MPTDKIDSDNAQWHARLATLLTASGKHDSAASHYQRALRGLDEAAYSETQKRRLRLQWQFDLAATETKRGERQKAIDLYETILLVDPTCVEAKVNMAAQLAITDESRLEEALGLCMQALELCPNLAEAHYNRNMLLRRLGRQKEAIRIYWACLLRDIGTDAIRGAVPEGLARVALPLVKQGAEALETSDAMSRQGHFSNQDSDADSVDGVTIVCVKWGTKYGSEYVNKLYNSITRHRGEPMMPGVAFVCLTDNSEGIQLHANLHIVPLQGGWKGWWNKCQVFSRTFTETLCTLGYPRCLYVDLDTVVVGSLVDMLRWAPPPGVLALLKTDGMVNEQRCGGYNSSIMAWHIDINDASTSILQFLHDFLQANFVAIRNYIYKFDHWLEMALPEAYYLEDVFPDRIVEYRSLDESLAILPPNASIVCFPLLPKPHNAAAPWVPQHWI